jgi:hypothetical protein
MLSKLNFNTKFLQKLKLLRQKIRKKYFFVSLKSLKKGVGSICQRYGSTDPRIRIRLRRTIMSRILNNIENNAPIYLEGQQFTRGVENTNMTDCISSL